MFKGKEIGPRLSENSFESNLTNNLATVNGSKAFYRKFLSKSNLYREFIQEFY
jgi:hypothetical protein